MPGCRRRSRTGSGRATARHSGVSPDGSVVGIAGVGGDGGYMRIGFMESGERGGTWVWMWDREWGE